MSIFINSYKYILYIIYIMYMSWSRSFRVTDRPISLEISFGNAGNSLDGELVTGRVDETDSAVNDDERKR